MEKPNLALARGLLSNGWVSQIYLCSVTGLPHWKISRLLIRLGLLGLIEVEKEPRFTRGRPRKLCRLTSRGLEYFSGLFGEAH